MTRTYNCFRKSAAVPRIVKGFINNTTNQRAAMDTAASLMWDDTDLIVEATCRCGEESVSMADRLVVHFDPAGRESDLLSVSVAPDGAVACTQLGTAFPHTNPTWASEPYAFPAWAETSLLNDGWRATVRMPIAAIFALRGGKAPPLETKS